ncbi:hypothetical protein PCL_08705 [Purpureocillium lilacinum]|uniref:Uncharacterized protein n=1 Tax=Purpureocillium lilacinum TaxID=33203 RepID=A0A2U3EFZ0_PURLI|nr:hypothetical protein PCL_08705 [Purpureocillium lilacinum]
MDTVQGTRRQDGDALGLVPPEPSLFTSFCVVSGSNARKREEIFKVQSRNGRYWGRQLAGPPGSSAGGPAGETWSLTPPRRWDVTPKSTIANVLSPNFAKGTAGA